MSLREVKLPSGRVLKITVAPFDDSRTLYQSVLEEVKGLKLDPEAEIDVNLFKDLFCVGLSSKKIEKALWKCFERATIDDLKVNNDLFEAVEHRDDYMAACFEVAKENIQPFTKSLFAQYAQILQTVQSGLASRLQKTP